MTTVHYDSETGETYIAPQHSGFDGSKQHVLENDYVQMEDGSFQHVFQNVELEDETGPQGFDFEEYVSGIQQVYPDLNDAVQWSIGNELVPEYLAIEWNNALDTQDLGRVNEIAEQLINLYLENNEGYVPEESDGTPPLEDEEYEEQTTDEWFESIPDEVLDETVDDLLDAEFTQDQVYAMQELHQQFDETSTEALMLEMGMSVSQGQLSMAEAIEIAIENYGEAEAAKAYFTLQNYLS